MDGVGDVGTFYLGPTRREPRFFCVQQLPYWEVYIYMFCGQVIDGTDAKATWMTLIAHFYRESEEDA